MRYTRRLKCVHFRHFSTFCLIRYQCCPDDSRRVCPPRLVAICNGCLITSTVRRRAARCFFFRYPERMFQEGYTSRTICSTKRRSRGVVARDHALVGVVIPNREHSVVWPGFGRFAGKPLVRTWHQTFLSRSTFILFASKQPRNNSRLADTFRESPSALCRKTALIP